MAVLQKLRGWGIILSILVALPLLLFIIDPSQIQSVLQATSSKYDVGEINGKSVSYNVFQAEVDRMSRIYEMSTGNSSQNERQQTEIRNAVWQDLLNRYLFVKNAQAAGITVGNAEMLDLTSGENISPVMMNNFMDNEGQFSRENLVAFLDNMENDPSGSYRLYWDYLKNTVENNQYYVKYNSLLTASNYENPLMLSKSIEENNVTADVDFVLSPYSFVTDSTIVVSDKEIRDYYESHRKFFRQQASRDIEYVVYQVVPSQEDIANEGEAFTALYDEFASTDNVRSFIQRNSDRSYSDYFYKTGELSSVNKEIEEFVAANTAGTSPIISDGNEFLAARILETAQLPDSVYVRHMMFTGSDAAHLADSLLAELGKGANFANLAAVYSDDKNSAYDGELGNLGWMTQTAMLPGFESVVSAKQRTPYVITTQYGTHIVEVTKATKPVLKKKVAIYAKTALASQETFNSYYNLANKFATLANGGLNNYLSAVDSMAKVKDAVSGTYSHPIRVYESTDTYGSIGHAKELTRWAFDNKPGKVSNIITVDNNYFFVAVVKAGHKEGYAKVEEVAQTIKDQLYAEKYSAKKTAETGELIAGLTDLEEIASKLNSTVTSQTGISFSSLNTRGLDPKLMGAVAAAPEGKICGPVEGSVGVYVFRVNGRETGSFYTEDDARNYHNQTNYYASQMLLPVMMDDADVKDNRARFY